MLLSLAFITQVSAGEHFPFLAKVTHTSVNVRAGSNTNFEKIDKLKQGDTVVALDKQFEWYKIQLPTTALAYVRADYLDQHEGHLAQIIGDKVHVRARPNAESSSLGLLTKGTVVQVLEVANGWAKLSPGVGMVGWVHQAFITKVSNNVDPELIYQPLSLPAVASK